MRWSSSAGTWTCSRAMCRCAPPTDLQSAGMCLRQQGLIEARSDNLPVLAAKWCTPAGARRSHLLQILPVLLLALAECARMAHPTVTWVFVVAECALA